MTLFLRNDENQSVVDIEINFKISSQDLHSSVSIEHYSKVLLDNLNRSDEVIRDFTEIDELRSWFWEDYMEFADKPSQKECVEHVEKKLILLANKYNLFYVTD